MRNFLPVGFVVLLLASCVDDDYARFRSQFGSVDSDMQRFPYVIAGGSLVAYVGDKNTDAGEHFMLNRSDRLFAMPFANLRNTRSFHEEGVYSAVADVGGCPFRITVVVPYAPMDARDGTFIISGMADTTKGTYFITSVSSDLLDNIDEVVMSLRAQGVPVRSDCR